MLQFLGRKKVPGESINNVKLPTPVANNHATAAALAIGNNNIELFDDDEDDESLPEEYVSTVKLNILIGIASQKKNYLLITYALCK